MAGNDGEMALTTLKILIIGESGVGKSRFVYSCLRTFYFVCFSSLMLRFVDDTFDPEISATIGMPHHCRLKLISFFFRCGFSCYYNEN